MTLELFTRIQQFLLDAKVISGTLQSPLVGTNTEIAIRPPQDRYLIGLHDMGGGVEQLLMIATVLLGRVIPHAYFSMNQRVTFIQVLSGFSLRNCRKGAAGFCIHSLPDILERSVPKEPLSVLA